MVVALGMPDQFKALNEQQNKIWSWYYGVIFPSVVFIVGSPMYYKAKPQGNIMLEVCKCIWVSMIDNINTSIQ